MTCLGLPDCGSENQPCRTQPSTDGCRTASGVSGSSPKPGPSSRSWRGRGATEKRISQPQNMACGSQLRPSSPLGTQLIGERFSLKDGLLTQLETPNAGAASLPGLPDTTFSPCMNGARGPHVPRDPNEEWLKAARRAGPYHQWSVQEGCPR